ncbi:hypothetical protein RLIN73S_03323 [Rhodanobacter lindaniclasticus]
MPVSGWAIECDYDGTVSVEGVIDSLLDRFGRRGWEVLEQEWRAGRFGSRECMAGQVEMLQTTRAELEAHLVEMWSTIRSRASWSRRAKSACRSDVGGGRTRSRSRPRWTSRTRRSTWR